MPTCATREGFALTLIFHANWSNSCLHLWGESLSAFRENIKSDKWCEVQKDDSGGTALLEGKKTLQIHPFTASDQELRNAVLTIMDQPDWKMESDTLDTSLPFTGNIPLPSERLSGLIEFPYESTSTHLDNCKVQSVSMQPYQAFVFLSRCLCVREKLSLEAGPGLEYMIDVSELVAELLLDQRFVPSICQKSGGVLQAVWLPWLDDENTRRRVEHLLLSMPPAFRATTSQLNITPWVMLEDAIRAMTDSTVRHVLNKEYFFDAIDDRDSTDDDSVAILHGLLDIETDVRTVDGQSAEIFRGMRLWLNRLNEGEIHLPYRMCLQIIEPDLEPTTGKVSLDDDARWTLKLHLQSTDTTFPPINIEDLWIGDATVSSIAGRTEELQEFVLLELTRAARVYERLKDTLSGIAPSNIKLTTLEAHDFLRVAGPILEEIGISVIAPEWWGQPEGRIGLKLLLNSGEVAPDIEQDSSDKPVQSVGLDTLVSFDWQVSVGDQPLSLEEFRVLAEQKSPLVNIAGRWIELRQEDFKQISKVLDEAELGEMSILDAMQMAFGLGSVSEDLPIIGIEAKGWIQDLIEGRSVEAQYISVEQPEAFNGELRPYQLAGLSWLMFLDRLGLGACLADDMGLGKTIQLIALLQHERAKCPANVKLGPTLVVSPMSVVSNWARELERFAPELKVHVQHGPERLLGDNFVKIADSTDVIVTTYGLVSRDLETFQQVRWWRVVLDEAQYVKNSPTKQAQAIRSLRSDKRIALTGTPVENRLSELWSIMDFLNHGYLGTAGEFRRRFAIPIERRRDKSRSDALRGLIRPFVLRRLKTDPDVVPDLPELVVTRVYAVLTREQRCLYEEVVSTMLRDVEESQGIRRRGLVLAGIVRLKQICNHPANLAEGVSLRSLEPATDVQLSKRSGKVQCLLETLEEVVAADDQALIFTQYRRMGDLLTKIIQHDLNIPVLFMHGGISRIKRQEMIDKFQSDETRTPVFVLSLRAGGVGLNLTAANHVFHFDRWWNPAVENQATDRAFRIGQKRTVQVHKMVCTGTLEEHIDEMIEKKTELADQIVGSGDAWLTELSTGQLRNVLALRHTAMGVDEE